MLGLETWGEELNVLFVQTEKGPERGGSESPGSKWWDNRSCASVSWCKHIWTAVRLSDRLAWINSAPIWRLGPDHRVRSVSRPLSHQGRLIRSHVRPSLWLSPGSTLRWVYCYYGLKRSRKISFWNLAVVKGENVHELTRTRQEWLIYSLTINTLWNGRKKRVRCQNDYRMLKGRKLKNAAG